MYDTIEEIAALIGEPESLRLEFKSGRGYADMALRETKCEFVKDVTAFANAGGGTIIIGLAEKDGIAACIEPVVKESKVKADRLTQIIESNTDPVFREFEIRELPYEDGRLFVIEVQQGHTAHQNRFDHLYYQRTGAKVSKMFDFAIRDVMNRRTHPIVKPYIGVRPMDDKRYFYFLPYLRNEGSVTAKQWMLHLDVPYQADIGAIRAGMPMRKIVGAIRRDGILFQRIEFSSAGTPDHPQSGRLMPGQELILNATRGFSSVTLKLDSKSAQYVEEKRHAIHWTLYTDDAQPQHHSYDFETWFCRQNNDDLNWPINE